MSSSEIYTLACFRRRGIRKPIKCISYIVKMFILIRASSRFPFLVVFGIRCSQYLKGFSCVCLAHFRGRHPGPVGICDCDLSKRTCIYTEINDTISLDTHIYRLDGQINVYHIDRQICIYICLYACLDIRMFIGSGLAHLSVYLIYIDLSIYPVDMRVQTDAIIYFCVYASPYNEYS